MANGCTAENVAIPGEQTSQKTPQKLPKNHLLLQHNT